MKKKTSQNLAGTIFYWILFYPMQLGLYFYVTFLNILFFFKYTKTLCLHIYYVCFYFVYGEEFECERTDMGIFLAGIFYAN